MVEGGWPYGDCLVHELRYMCSGGGKFMFSRGGGVLVAGCIHNKGRSMSLEKLGRNSYYH